MGAKVRVSVMEIIITILGGVVSVLAGGVATSDLTKHLLKFLLKGKLKPEELTYSEKLERLSSALSQTSREFDDLLRELAAVAKSRERAVQSLEANMKGLEARERELQEKIRHLEKVPLPVAEYFASLTTAGEKKSVRRDYLLFTAGVTVSTIIAILLHLFHLT
jgi:hypothetical protein